MFLSVFSSIVVTIFIEDTNITNQWFTEGSYNTLLFVRIFFFSVSHCLINLLVIYTVNCRNLMNGKEHDVKR